MMNKIMLEKNHVLLYIILTRSKNVPDLIFACCSVLNRFRASRKRPKRFFHQSSASRSTWTNAVSINAPSPFELICKPSNLIPFGSFIYFFCFTSMWKWNTFVHKTAYILIISSKIKKKSAVGIEFETRFLDAMFKVAFQNFHATI